MHFSETFNFVLFNLRLVHSFCYCLLSYVSLPLHSLSFQPTKRGRKRRTNGFWLFVQLFVSRIQSYWILLHVCHRIPSKSNISNIRLVLFRSFQLYLFESLAQSAKLLCSLRLRFPSRILAIR